ncbi:hypothetical protein NST12_16820 [Bacillus sp. FSL W8-1127]|uniref:hypothetical protein n=2 Tax=Bacillaceae TaxID=186817 RepID=UPI0030F7ADD6
MKFKKGVISFVSAVTLLGSSVPITSFAQAQDSPPSTIQKVDIKELKKSVTKEQVADVQKMVNVISELDRKVNMDNLSANTQKDINKLSKEAKEFYYLYEQVYKQNDGKFDVELTLATLNYYYNSMNNTSTQSGTEVKENTFSIASTIGSVKTYKLSNQQVNDIIKMIGVHGAGWGLMTAIAKYFAKSPTWITAMIIAIPTLGAAVLNACNRYNKGVIIKDVRIGATHNWSCSAVR